MLYVGLTYGFFYQPSFIVHFFAYSIVFQLIYIGITKPLEFLLHWKLELFNEFMLLVDMYFFVLYTGVVPDPMVIYNIGWAHIAQMGLILVINFVVIAVISLQSLLRFIKLRNLKNQMID